MKTEKIGDYKVLEGPFSGGFGDVYKVLDPTWCDEFALKTMKGPVLTSSARIAQFRKEVELWISLPTHSNVVRAIEAFIFEGRPCLVMEWVSGGSLRERIGSFGAVEALAICRQLVEGVHHIHKHGIVHGDLKPANVLMWGNLCPQISDFGLANALTDKTVRIAGTRNYMAPELQSGNATPLSDMYALGVVFREILMPSSNEDFGVASTRTLISEMVRTNPSERPQSCSQLLDRLNKIIRDPPYWPFLVVAGNDRRTFKEKTIADALPERFLMSQAHSEIAAGRQDHAKSTLMQVLAQHPNHVDALTMLADLTAKDGDIQLAISYLRKAKNAAENPVQLFNICVSLVWIEEYAEAREILGELADSKDISHKVWHLQGDIANKEGDLSEALMCYRQAVASGGDSSVVFSLGRALNDAGFLDEAIEVLREIDVNDDQVGIHAQIVLARCLISKRQWEEAANTLRQCLTLDVGTETAYLYSELGYAYMQQQLFDAAIAAYQKALHYNPDSETVMRNLKFCRARLQR